MLSSWWCRVGGLQPKRKRRGFTFAAARLQSSSSATALSFFHTLDIVVTFFSCQIGGFVCCLIAIMAAGKAAGKGKAAASFDEIIQSGTATPA